jgi:CheY-like chemotaxis protein
MENTDHPTVMIADDYDDVRAILKGWFEQQSYRVVEAKSGKEAVELAGREQPSLIIMDLAMPEIDGFGAAFLIRSQKDLRDVPIVGISAYGELGIDEQLKVDPEALGFNAYLPKPFAPEKLFAIVDRYLPHRRDD